MAEFCWVSSLKKGTDVQHLEAKNMREHGDEGAWGRGAYGRRGLVAGQAS